jgi:hypothetical protein
VKHRQLARLAARIEQDLNDAGFAATWVRRNAEDVARRANSDMDDAVAGICYEPSPRSGDPSNPTERKALAASGDMVAKAVQAMDSRLRSAKQHAYQARLDAQAAENIGRSLLAIEAEHASQIAGADQLQNDEQDQRKGYVCANLHCQRTVSNTPNDRLRSGRCDACRKYLVRNGVERPAHLCSEDQAEEVLEQPCGHPVWVPGVGERPCVLPSGTTHVCRAG